ncbi:MAG: NYN domain-containing protein [Acidobacteriota bacterium]|nr:NYN domain-containing protein [Acidobacteriota bacterium]
MSESTILVDGYNLLIDLARRERVRDLGERLPRLRHRLLELLSDYAEHGDESVVVVWDGHGAAPTGLSGRLRVVFVEPPAEADDFIVTEAKARAARGLKSRVVTRDRGLLRRLPAGCETLPIKRLAEDLLALASGPVSARHVTGPRDDEAENWVPATEGPLDLSRLPRRRVRQETAGPEEPAPVPARASRAVPRRPRKSSAPLSSKRARPAPVVEPDAEEAGRAASQARREEKRKRWERAQKRRSGAARKKK